MDVTPYVARMRSELVKATALADENTRETALRLADSLEAGLRLSYLHLLADAAAELTSALDDRVVEVRLDGDAPVLTVAAGMSAPPAEPPAKEDEGTARITLRLPDTIKTRADQAAGAAGVSLNSWIVSACRAALQAPSTNQPPTTTARRYTGWA